MLVAFVLALVCALLWRRNLLEGLTLAIVAFFAYLYLLTELLSAAVALTAGSVRAGWCVACLALAALLVVSRARGGRLWQDLPALSRPRPEALAYLAYALGVLVLAMRIVPYNVDSMIYHLARIDCWATNRTVAHFETTILRNVESAPMGEFVNLHVYLLSGYKDVLFNLLQAASYLCCGLYVWGVSRRVGAQRAAAAVATLLFLGTPIALSEAFTTQNDVFVALWAMAFVAVVLSLAADPIDLGFDAWGRARLCCLGALTGFAYLTKPSVLIAMVIFAIWLVARCLRQGQGLGRVLAWCAGTLAVALAVTAPELLRNLQTFGSPLGPWQGKGQLVLTADPRFLLLSLVKNLCYSLPGTAFPVSNARLVAVVQRLAAALGIAENDPLISEDGRPFYLLDPVQHGCDEANISPVLLAVLVCLAVSLVLFVADRLRRPSAPAGAAPASSGLDFYPVVSFASLFVFLTVVKWEPWVGRYGVGYAALACPGVAWCVQSWIGRAAAARRLRPRAVMGAAVAGAFALLACVSVYAGLRYNFGLMRAQAAAPGGRWEAYYGNGSVDFLDEFTPVREGLDSYRPKTVGFMCNGYGYTYPELALFRSRGIEARFVCADNVTARYRDPSFHPDVIVGVIYDEAEGALLEYNGTSYQVHHLSDDAWFALPL